MHASVLAHDPELEWRPEGPPVVPAETTSTTGADPASPPPGRPAAHPAVEQGLGRRPSSVRRLLVVCSALAVAAAASIVVVTRPWEGERPTSLPANSVGLIDSGGGRAGAPVPVDSPAGLAYGVGSVWAVDSADNRLLRIDPATHHVVDQITVGTAPTAVTVTGQDVWIANSGDGTVSRINAAANDVVDTIPVGNVPVAIASGPSGVWVANQGDDTVDRINPTTGAVTRRNIPVGGGPDGIAVGPDAVWVANGQDATVTRIDPDTGQPSGPVFVGAGPSGVAVTPSAVWVANSLDLSVTKIDPVANRVTATIPIGDGPHTIVRDGDGVWVGDEFDATLAHINPRTGRVRKIFVGSSPHGLAITSSGVWVAARPLPFPEASHRGGTLTVVTQWPPQPDPTQALGGLGTPTLATAYDGLVALRRSGGAQGLTLVPDLAIRLPRPTDGGRTYTFTLRPGVHYSNSTLVHASDFRRSIQRLLLIGGPAATYYKGIIGAQACRPRHPPCDLAAGIATDDAIGTITIHLTRADPDFLHKLALLFAVPVPPGTSSRVIDRAPFLPGTGPYMISQYRPPPARGHPVRWKVSFTLVRNPYFHQWSYAAQPAGYPDVIDVERMRDPKAQLAAVKNGTADLVSISAEGQSYRDLALLYPTRLHHGPKIWTTYVFLNTRRSPFNNIKARQAVNYAIDRARVLRLVELGPGGAVVTCQILPADFPGHQRYCPYTAGAKDGVWHGPDLEKAKRLTKQSGTTEVPVRVWNVKGSKVGLYLVQLLQNLGYHRATLRTVSADEFFGTVGNSSAKIQIGLTGWGADFPAPSTFFQPVLSCQSFYPHTAENLNVAEYCNPTVDRLTSRAQAEQVSDPATARKLWARVDATVTDDAPWVPVVNRSTTEFVSARVGNFQESAGYGPLLDQIWLH
jgi:YVTN family beta-propeller protein